MNHNWAIWILAAGMMFSFSANARAFCRTGIGLAAPAAPGSTRALAEKLYAEGDFDSSLAHFESALHAATLLNSNTEKAEALWGIGVVQRQLQRRPEALEAMQQTAILADALHECFYGVRARIHMELAEDYLDAKDNDAARNEEAKVFKIINSTPKLEREWRFHLLARGANLRDFVDDVEGYTQRLQGLTPDIAEIEKNLPSEAAFGYIMLGDLERRASRFEQARVFYQKSKMLYGTSLAPDHPQMVRLQERMVVVEDKLKDVFVEPAECGFEFNSGNAWKQAALNGWKLYSENNYRGAIEAFDEAMRGVNAQTNALDVDSTQMQSVGGRNVVLKILRTRSYAHRALNHRSEAEEDMQRSAVIAESIVECSPAARATTFEALAESLIYNNKVAEGETAAIKAFQALENTKYADNSERLVLLARIGDSLLHSSNKAALAEVVSKVRPLLILVGEDYPYEAGRAASFLGDAAYNDDHFAEAQTFKRKALALFERHYAPNNPAIAREIYELADILYSQGEVSQAWALFQRAKTILEAGDPETNADSLGTLLAKMSSVAAELNDWDFALENSTKAYELNIKGVPVESYKYSMAGFKLARILSAYSPTSSSFKLAMKAMRIYGSRFVELDDVQTASVSWDFLAGMQERAHNLREASEAWEKTLELSELLPANNATRLVQEYQYAQAKLEVLQPEIAIIWARRSMEGFLRRAALENSASNVKKETGIRRIVFQISVDAAWELSHPDPRQQCHGVLTRERLIECDAPAMEYLKSVESHP